MRGKLLFVTGIAVGYVLGARAGRKRYEQIKSAAESVWNTPTVQKGVDSAREFAFARVGDVSDTLLDGAKKLVKSATNSKPRSGQASPAQRSTPMKAPTPTTSAAPVSDPSSPVSAGSASVPTSGSKKPAAGTTTAKPATPKAGASSDSE
jgi:hypothetical protein